MCRGNNQNRKSHPLKKRTHFLIIVIIFIANICAPLQSYGTETFHNVHEIDKADLFPMDELKYGLPVQKIVYLTFDDGPSKTTDKLLNLLNHYHAKATFFMLKPNILLYPKSVKRMAREGFTPGLHGVSHDAKEIYRSKRTVIQEMKEDQQTLEQISGIKTPLVRTPYGSFPYMQPEYREALKNKGFIMWDWNVDSHDWKIRSWRFNQVTIEGIKKIEKGGKYSVVLLHDRPSTCRYIEPLLKYLSNNHYQMEAITFSMSPLQFRTK